MIQKFVSVVAVDREKKFLQLLFSINMTTVLKLFALCFSIKLSAAFSNVDLRNPIFVHGPFNAADAYFGYSIALDATGSVFVGAPGFLTGGAVFRCDFDGRRVENENAICEAIRSPTSNYYFNLIKLYVISQNSF